MEKYFTQTEALEAIIETLENGYNGYYSDLHNEVFNTDYYIVYTDEAETALLQYGVFDALREVQQYEDLTFGEPQTSLDDPFKVANMLWYVIGYDIINELETINNYWNEKGTEQVNALIIDELRSMI